MSDLVNTARKIATKAHEGQLYGTGDPYILHPTQTALLAERLGYCEEVVAACYLHDVLEDTELTNTDLRKYFPTLVVDAVLAVTFFGSDNNLKIDQALSHPLGHVVKFCDASCNYSNTVLHGAKEGKKASEVIPRRAWYIARLIETLPTPQQIESYVQHNK